MDEHHMHELKIYLHKFNADQFVVIDFPKRQTTGELIAMVLKRLSGHSAKATNYNSDENDVENFDLVEIMGTLDGQTCKERKLDLNDYPVTVKLLWPRCLPTGPDDVTNLTEYRFVLREKGAKVKDETRDSFIDSFLQKFLQQQTKMVEKDYPDLCMLPELTEQTMMENLKLRFQNGYFYTYIGPILLAVNPFKFYPIYNPKYAKLYENRRMGDLPPHIFAVSDSAYYSMLKHRRNQCIVISGESGSGKTESTNFLLHHLTTLTQKGAAASGVEQTLLCAGPVLEAFGNAVTAQNNNSSRFGKFLQINYRENGMVYGANVQIYLLEKSRLISRSVGDRNYHIFYYLLNGSTDEEKEKLCLLQPQDYSYISSQDSLYKIDGIDDSYELNRLKDSMEAVGFSQNSVYQTFRIISAILLLGNIQYSRRLGYHSDDTAFIANEDCISTLSSLLQLKEDKLHSALTTRRTVTKTDTAITLYSVREAKTARDAIAKCLYNALFDWIVFRINQSLVKRETSTASKLYSIGILDIFGFEDLSPKNINSFEQLCINYTNERLQAYFNQHVFQFEQEEYINQGLSWTCIEYTDNTACLRLLHTKPYGLFSLIDEECSVPKGTDETLLNKFNKYQKNNEFYETPVKKESSFIIAHYAGKVKYVVTGFNEKNKDPMRQDLINVFKNSRSCFVRELVCTEPLAMYRWAIVRALFRALFAFRQALKTRRKASMQAVTTTQKSAQHRRSSDGQVFSHLKADFDQFRNSRLCDTSVFSTIMDHVSSNSGSCRDRYCSMNGFDTTIDVFQSVDTNELANKNQSLLKNHDCHIGHSATKNQNFCNNNNSDSLDISTLASASSCFDDGATTLPKKLFVKSRVDRFEKRFMPDDKVPNGNPVHYPCNCDTITTITTDSKFFRHSHAMLDADEVYLRRGVGRQRKNQRSLRGLQALKTLVGKRQALSRKTCTVVSQFQQSMSRLMDTLSNAHPFFIRCIKSNNDKVPCLFDEDIILKQLRYTGMLETVRIRRAGYSVRMTYEEFAQQYQLILPSCGEIARGVASLVDLSFEEIKARVMDFIERHPIIDRQNIQFGSAKVFMRDAEKLLLDDQLHRNIVQHVRLLQSWFRTVNARRRYVKLRRAVINMQAMSRGLLARRELQKRVAAALCIQSNWRSYVERKRFLQTFRTLIRLQALCRGFSLRREFESAKALNQKMIPRVVLSAADDTEADIMGRRLRSESRDTESSDFFDDDDNLYGAAMSRAMSLDATFILENAKLKLLDIQDDIDVSNQGRRPSTALHPFRAEGRNNLTELKSEELVDASRRELREDANRKKKTGFFRAKKHIQAFLSLRSESPDSLDIDEGLSDYPELLKPQVPGVRRKMHKGSEAFFPSPLLIGQERLGSQLDEGHFTTFTASNHVMKLSRFAKVEPCSLCSKNVAGFLLTGYKCQLCKLTFHEECSQFAGSFPCNWCSKPSAAFPSVASSPLQRLSTPTVKQQFRPWDQFLNQKRETKHPKADSAALSSRRSQQSAAASRWNLTRTSQFTDSSDVVVGSAGDLRQLGIFIFQKLVHLSKRNEAHRDTIMDSVFKKSLEEYHNELLSHLASLKDDDIVMKYKDLVTMFEGTLSKVCIKQQTTFPVTLGLNAFRVFITEFSETKRKRFKAFKRKQRKISKKAEMTLVHLNHCLKGDIVHVPTYCEVCNQFMWYSEKILICSNCRISCHKKCYIKLTQKCGSKQPDATYVGCGRVFGADLSMLVDDEHYVPSVLEKLLMCIEVQGLFYEGLYRKSGSLAQIKQLRRLIESTEDFNALNFDDIPVHVMTSLVKAFFRELKEPLLTFELYENFLSVAEIQDEKERYRCTYAMVQLLPKTNKYVFERLVYHLARVVHHCEVNKMSSQNLAVIFAPCVLKRQQEVKAQEQLNDVNKQTICLSTLIDEKLRKCMTTLSDIVKLESAVEKVNENLRKIDQHLLNSDASTIKRLVVATVGHMDQIPKQEFQNARRIFLEQLNYLDKEKDKLIDELPSAPPLASSEDDNVTNSSADEFDLSEATVNDESKASRRSLLTPRSDEELAIDINLPPSFSNLTHLTTKRVARPRVRLPSKYATLKGVRPVKLKVY